VEEALMRPRRGLHRRLDRLMPHFWIEGCTMCQGWTGVVLAGDDSWHRPEQCPDCGRVVPATLVVQLVGVPVAQL
jgi:hypothetical protein